MLRIPEVLYTKKDFFKIAIPTLKITFKCYMVIFNKASNSNSKVIVLIYLIYNKLLFLEQPALCVIAYGLGKVFCVYFFKQSIVRLLIRASQQCIPAIQEFLKKRMPFYRLIYFFYWPQEILLSFGQNIYIHVLLTKKIY